MFLRFLTRYSVYGRRLSSYVTRLYHVCYFYHLQITAFVLEKNVSVYKLEDS